MPPIFWIKRFVTVFLGAFAIIAAAQLLKANSIQYSVTHGAIWAVISASIFVGARYSMAKRNIPCALCKDTPEFADSKSQANH